MSDQIPNKRDMMLTLILKKENGKLIHLSKGEEAMYKLFVENIQEGQKVEVFFDAVNDNGSYPQLSKIHKCMREIAKETGTTFHSVKREVKKRTGLAIFDDEDNDLYSKSLANCSRDDLNLIINTIIEIGDMVGVNCR